MLPQRLLGHAGSRLGQHAAVHPGSKCGVQPGLFGLEAQLLQPGRFDQARRPAVQLGQRRSTPQGQRLAQLMRGPVRRPERVELPALVTKRSNR